ncbi:MAG: flagellar hook-associated protein 3 [Brevinemataceae bacterium]
MTGRITHGFMQNDFLFNAANRYEKMQKQQSQLTSNMKIHLPSDDPANTANYMEWEGRKSDIGKFNEIISAHQEKMNIVDSNLDIVANSLQRARELAVQAANGTFNKDDRVIIAGEIDQIIRQVVSDANVEYKGIPLFGGTSTTIHPYRMKEMHHPDLNVPVVSGVEYFGNAQERIMDVGRNDRVVSISPGSTIFQTSKTTLQGRMDVGGYIAPSDSRIVIEGIEISISSGDSPDVIAQKINAAGTTVTASVQSIENGNVNFRLTSISPRQPWVQDIEGGTIMQDLGITTPGPGMPNNLSPEAVSEKVSVFDTLITLRDNLLKDDVLAIGGEDLSILDKSLNNVIRYRSYTGAVSERLEKTFQRNETESFYLTNASSNAVYVDFTKTLTEFKMMEFAHQAALNIGAKILPTTLMDFLR